jgi:hypothetical protein
MLFRRVSIHYSNPKVVEVHSQTNGHSSLDTDVWCWLVLGCAAAMNPIELKSQKIEALHKKAQTFLHASPESN